MNTIERAKEIARLYSEIEACTTEIEALLGGDTVPMKRSQPKEPEQIASKQKNKGGAGTHRGPRLCGQCRQPGHTYQTCPKYRTEDVAEGEPEQPEQDHVYPEDQYADEIRRMHENGASPATIAEVLEIPVRMVQKVINMQRI